MVASQMQLAEGKMARSIMVASQMQLAEGKMARSIMVASQMQLAEGKDQEHHGYLPDAVG